MIYSYRMSQAYDDYFSKEKLPTRTQLHHKEENRYIHIIHLRRGLSKITSIKILCTLSRAFHSELHFSKMKS